MRPQFRRDLSARDIPFLSVEPEDDLTLGDSYM